MYTSYIIGALPLDLFVISDELKITIKKVINILKIILLEFAFFDYRWDIEPQIFLTDNLAEKRNTLKLC